MPVQKYVSWGRGRGLLLTLRIEELSFHSDHSWRGKSTLLHDLSPNVIAQTQLERAENVLTSNGIRLILIRTHGGTCE